NDLPRLAIGNERLADDVWIAAELVLPISITDDRGISGARRVFLVSEPAPKHRCHGEQRQNRFCHIQRSHLLGFAGSLDAQRGALINANILKTILALLAINEVVRGRHVEVLDAYARRGMPHSHQLVRTLVGQGLEQNAFEYAEYNGIAADSGGQ